MIKEPYDWSYALGRLRDGYYAEICAERDVRLDNEPAEDRAGYIAQTIHDLALSRTDWDEALSEFVPPPVLATAKAGSIPREEYTDPAMPKMSDDAGYAYHLMEEQRSGRFPEVPSLAATNLALDPAIGTNPADAAGGKGVRSGRGRTKTYDHPDLLQEMLDLLKQGKAASVNAAATQTSSNHGRIGASIGADVKRLSRDFTDRWATKPPVGKMWSDANPEGGWMDINPAAYLCPIKGQ